MEKKVQTRMIKYLKHKGCYVIKTRPGAGTPVGCPDVIFFKEGFWGCLEIKASEKSSYRPLQKQTLEKLNDWSFGRTVFPENENEIVAELDNVL